METYDPAHTAQIEAVDELYSQYRLITSALNELHEGSKSSMNFVIKDELFQCKRAKEKDEAKVNMLTQLLDKLTQANFHEDQSKSN